MIIGIDGGAISISDDRLRVGVYRVARNLIKELSRLNVKNDYRVYSFDRGEGSKGEKISENIRYIQLPRPGFQKIWQTLEIFKHPIDVYLGFSQSIPLLLYDVIKIGFIYDVAFLDNPQFYPASVTSLTDQTKQLVARANHIITISHTSSDQIQKYFDVPEDKISVAYLGVEKVFTQKGPVYKSKLPYFLFVGALKPGKNVPALLRAFSQFLQTHKKPYDLVLIGSDFWMDPEIMRTITSLDLSHRIKIVGFVDDQTLSSYYRGATAVITLSVAEGFGLPIIEAMASAAPVIASNTKVHKEIAGEAALFVSQENIWDVVRAMETIARIDKSRKRYIQSGLVWSSRYRWPLFAKTVLSVIEKVKNSYV